MLKVKYWVYTNDTINHYEIKTFNTFDEITTWLKDEVWNGGYCYVPHKNPIFNGNDWIGSFHIRIKDWWNGCTDCYIRLIEDENTVKYTDGIFTHNECYCDAETEEWLTKIKPIFCK